MIGHRARLNFAIWVIPVAWCWVSSAAAVESHELVGYVPAGFVTGTVGDIETDDSAVDVPASLRRATFPWYDADEQRLSKVKLPPIARAKTLDRGQLEPYVPRQQPRNFNFQGTDLSGLNVVSWILVALVIAMIVGLLIWAFFRLEGKAMAKRAATEDVPESLAERIKELPFDFHQLQGDFREMAWEAYRAGDVGRAMMLLFSHVLLALDRQGLLRLRRGKTNRQYLRELHTFQPLAAYFQRVMVPFEESFFGQHAIPGRRFEECWNGLDGFQKAIEQSTRSAEF